eukprot:GILJ01007294.1.p1 GENE.GILJ01007294.1~~GILJ01007294.1.p1  ORF type:complete len:682 (+),score=96.47 GILJ01007294.1:45-2090(+)
MELHRCRFVHWQPQPIDALAFSTDGQYLAVGRANSDIEIWNVANGWHWERTIAGGENRSVRSLIWVCMKSQQRLLSAGLHGNITEWNLQALKPFRSTDSYGGAVWCMAAENSGERIAAGCDDGCIRLFRLNDSVGEGVDYIKSFTRQEGRILSVCWSHDSAVIFSGASDGTIRKWDTLTGRCLQRITVESFGKEKTLIWAVRVLKDMTVISGDSLGHVQFWDGKQGTLLKSFSQHVADVLTVAVDDDEATVFAAGVDNKVTAFQRVLKDPQAPVQRWVCSGSARSHSHDVRALALFGSSLVSGGVDTKLCVYAAQNLANCRPLQIAPFPQRPIIQSVASLRVLLCQHPRMLELWYLGVEGEDHEKPQPVKLLEIQPKGEEHLISSALSADGSWVACSTVFGLKLFKIDLAELSVQKVVVHNAAQLAGNQMVFTPESSLLLVSTLTGRLEVLDLASLSSKHFFLLKGNPVAESIVSPATHMEVSSDGQWVAVGTVDNSIQVFNLDTLQRHVELPALDSQHTTFAFHPTGSILVVACVTNQFYLFDIEDRKLTDWSREYSHRLPQDLLRRREKITGIAFNPGQPSSLLLYGHSFICHVDLEKPVPVSDHGVKKRRLAPAAEDTNGHLNGCANVAGNNFQIITKYQSVLSVHFLKANSLVVVELPWLKVMQDFPDALHRPRYGT